MLRKYVFNFLKIEIEIFLLIYCRHFSFKTYLSISFDHNYLQKLIDLFSFPKKKIRTRSLISVQSLSSNKHNQIPNCYVGSRALIRLEFQVAHLILNVTLATDQKLLKSFKCFKNQSFQKMSISNNVPLN